MRDFIIDTPMHKRWLLPDGKHIYNIVTYGTFFHITIIEQLSGRIVNQHTVDMIKPGWNDLLALSQELANKKYRKPLRYVRR